MFKRLIREPFVHFVLLGAAVFGLYAAVGGNERAPDDRRIVVPAGKVKHLATLFTKTWQRSPTRGELQALIDDYVREEAAYREGLAIGLDVDDTVIRRRVRQKLDFVAEDLATQTPPTVADLEAYLADHPEKFARDPVLTFRQVYLDPAQHGDNLDATAAALLEQLNADPSLDPATLGDRIMLDQHVVAEPVRRVTARFGRDFGAAVAALEPGVWHGPVPSGFGVHLVMVESREPGGVPDLDDIRDTVQREWEHQRRTDAAERFYRGMLDRYEIVVTWPEGLAPEPPGMTPAPGGGA